MPRVPSCLWQVVLGGCGGGGGSDAIMTGKPHAVITGGWKHTTYGRAPRFRILLNKEDVLLEFKLILIH